MKWKNAKMLRRKIRQQKRGSVIKGIAFDLEGPLVNTERHHFSGFFVVVQKLGIGHLGFTEDPLSFEKLIPGAIGGGDLFIFENLLKMANQKITPERIEELKIHKTSHHNRIFSKLIVTPRPGVKEVVEYIKNVLHIPVAIGSATSKNKAKFLFEQSGVNDWFPKGNIVLQEDVKSSKPAPDVYFETAKRMGIKPSEQLVFEDSGIGIKAGIAAGSKVIAMSLYDMPYYCAKLENLGASKTFTSWLDPELLPYLVRLVKGK